jgi:hypothetical protein
MPFNVVLQTSSAAPGLADQVIEAQTRYVSIESQLASLKNDITALQANVSANTDFPNNVNVATELGNVITKITNAENDLL